MTDTAEYPIDINPSTPMPSGLRAMATLTSDWTLSLADAHREAIQRWTEEAWPSVARQLPESLRHEKMTLIHSVIPMHRHEDGTESGDVYLLMTSENRYRASEILREEFGPESAALDFSVRPVVTATWDVPLPITCDDEACACHLPWGDPEDLVFEGAPLFSE